MAERQVPDRGVQAQPCGGGGGGGELTCLLCPCLLVRVSFSVCASLQQMQLPSLTDHMTLTAALDSSLCVWGGTWEGLSGNEVDGLGTKGDMKDGEIKGPKRS